MTFWKVPILISAFLVGCAAFSSPQVYTTRPDRLEQVAEVSFIDAENQRVSVWEVKGSHGGVAQTDYMSLPTPIWLKPGTYRFTHGCPGLVHSYDTKATILVRAPGRYHLSCGTVGKLSLVAEQT
jgi:hypothetical protein